MPYITTTGGLNFQYPTDGTTNWGQTLATTWAAISAHDHSGGNKGTAIAASSLANNSLLNAKCGFTWSTYVPTYGGDGTNTFTLTATDCARYLQLGKFAAVIVEYRGVVSGTTGSAVSVTLPLNSANQFSCFFATASNPNSFVSGSSVPNIRFPCATKYVSSSALVISMPNFVSVSNGDCQIANGSYTISLMGVYETV